MTAEQYHDDPVITPSLSASIARELVDKSPRHAWFIHPRLNPEHAREEKTMFDLGTVTHAYMLERDESRFAVIYGYDDWKKKDAQVKRDLARIEGKIPILAHQWAGIKAMVEAAQPQLDEAGKRQPPRPLGAGGKPERTVVWKEGRAWCRARFDWVHSEPMIDDLKTTAGSANPDVWMRTQLYRMGFDIQVAFYRRGYRAIFGQEPNFRFIVQENFPPYELSVIALAPAADAVADEKVEYAIHRWEDCLTENEWPGYTKETCFAEVPPWEEARWRERQFHRQPVPAGASADDDRPIADLLFGQEED